MIIGGLQKLTLLDYPEHVACSVFLKGCNFCCPFCYNSSLIDADDKLGFIDEQEFFNFLNKRKGILDGVAITGGEPLLQKDIVKFIKKIKELGYAVKLDTNGSIYDTLRLLIDQRLVDYVAMDIKNSLEKYPLTSGCNCNVSNVEKSIKLLLENKVDYEFRTTIVKEFHNESDLKKIGQMIKGAKRYFIQSYTFKESVIDKTLHAHSKEKLEEFKNIVAEYVANTSLRGID